MRVTGVKTLFLVSRAQTYMHTIFYVPAYDCVSMSASRENQVKYKQKRLGHAGEARQRPHTRMYMSVRTCDEWCQRWWSLQQIVDRILQTLPNCEGAPALAVRLVRMRSMSADVMSKEARSRHQNGSRIQDENSSKPELSRGVPRGLREW